MPTNLSYTFQALFSTGSTATQPVEQSLSKNLSIPNEIQRNSFQSKLAQASIKVQPPQDLNQLDTFVEKASDTVSNFGLALDVIQPMVSNFQGMLSIKNGLLLSALLPIVNLPLQKGNRQLLSESPWGRITEAVLTTITWLPICYSGGKEVLSTTLDTYQKAKQQTGSDTTAQSHALSKGMIQTSLELMALVLGPYALMSLSDFLISESFYRSRALSELEGKSFSAIMSIIKSKAEFAHEHAFIDKHDLENSTLDDLKEMPVFKGALQLSNADGLVSKALLRRFQRGEMVKSSFLQELGVTCFERIPVILQEIIKQAPKVLRNEMPARIDSKHVLSQLGEIFIREKTEEKTGTLVAFDRVKAYLGTQEFRLGSYKTMSSLTLLAVWYLCLDPFINRLANALLTPLVVKHTNRQLVREGQPPYYPPRPKLFGSKQEGRTGSIKNRSLEVTV